MVKVDEFRLLACFQTGPTTSPMECFRTPARALRHEIPKIKGSRFIASLEPVTSIDAAQGFIAERRKEFHDATHNVYAWRLGRGSDLFRASDDGEPSGTAGRPVLQEIDSRRLSDLVVVVTRYFGGTKLGTGPLARAYAQAAAELLDRAEIRRVPIVETLVLTHDYALTGEVQGVLARFALKPEQAEYGVEVTLRIAVPVDAVDSVDTALRDATAGRIHLARV